MTETDEESTILEKSKVISDLLDSIKDFEETKIELKLGKVELKIEHSKKQSTAIVELTPPRGKGNHRNYFFKISNGSFRPLWVEIPKIWL